MKIRKLSNNKNQKASANRQDSLIRRSVELNHIPDEGYHPSVNRWPTPVGFSLPYLRDDILSNHENKNNPVINEIVSGTFFEYMTSTDTRYFNYSKSEKPVKPNYKLTG